MDKNEAKSIVNQWNRVGKKCGYKDITINTHFLVSLRELLDTMPEADPESLVGQWIRDYLKVIEAIEIVEGGFLE